MKRKIKKIFLKVIFNNKIFSIKFCSIKKPTTKILPNLLKGTRQGSWTTSNTVISVRLVQHVKFIDLFSDYTDKKIVNEAILDGMEAHSKTDGFSKNFEIPIYLAQNFSLINYMKKNKHKV